MISRGLKDEQWNCILEFLKANPNVYVGNEDGCRLFVEGACWVRRTGAQWRDHLNLANGVPSTKDLVVGVTTQSGNKC